MDEIRFLTLQEVNELHDEALERFGGQAGIIDQNVIEAATAAPQQSFGGQYLHEDIAAMAAAYLRSFSTSQGFQDGNERTAVLAATTFLAMNGYRLRCADLDLYDTAMRTANKLMKKDEVADWIRERLTPLE